MIYQETADQTFEQAIFDVATSDPVTGAALYVEATMPVARSMEQAVLKGRFRIDCRTASDVAADKRRRYAGAGSALVPLAFEDGGRPAEETVAFVRRCGAAKEALAGAVGHTALLWQQASVLLQIGNAELVLTSLGF